MSALHIKWLCYYWICYFSGIELYVSYDWWVTALIMHCGLFLICHFVHMLSITRTLPPPEVYQACTTQIKSCTTGCGCDIFVGVSFVGVSENGGSNVQNVWFSLSLLSTCTQTCSKTPYFEHMWTMTGNLQPQICIAKFSWYSTPFCMYFKYNSKLWPSWSLQTVPGL